ncbi:prion-like-(Q/N-rich) domain-bearing protein 25 [Anthonomus grandis grandis]|uniref:prion-like-(Q/N-rich) domain-bearing protein 25 n=1 Tax=Anthonomus grandis grandis TaxID=2921223 RepID=UPI0021656607|nr:prion-like-(Q/N-rich) domain-bearing protein 25 [Anthonomus grandis grandis]
MFRLILGAVVVFFVFVDPKKVICQENEANLEDIRAKLTEALVSHKKCLTDTDCFENSFCYGNDNQKLGLCKCLYGWEMLFRNRTYYMCLKFANYGENCVLDIQCQGYLGTQGLCDNGICACTNNSFKYPWDGMCYQRVLLGDICKASASCMLDDNSYGVCKDSRCRCYLGLRPSLDQRQCIDARNLGEDCTDDIQCSFTDNSVCMEICRCKMGYVVSRNESTCLKAAKKFYDPCSENDQCSEFLQDSICINGNCSCQSGYHSYGDKCVKSANIGQACGSAAQCLPSASSTLRSNSIVDCIEGVCQCLVGSSNQNETFGCNVNEADIKRLNMFMYLFCLILITIINTYRYS